jgi:hypothetical protein
MTPLNGVSRPTGLQGSRYTYLGITKRGEELRVGHETHIALRPLKSKAKTAQFKNHGFYRSHGLKTGVPHPNVRHDPSFVAGVSVSKTPSPQF